MSDYLTAAELAQIQTDILGALPDTCSILSVTSTPDGYGGQTDTWSIMTANVACRVSPVRGQEIQAGVAQEMFYRFIVTLPVGTVVNHADRIRVGTQDYDVVSVDTGKSWSTCVRVEVEKI